MIVRRPPSSPLIAQAAVLATFLATLLTLLRPLLATLPTALLPFVGAVPARLRSIGATFLGPLATAGGIALRLLPPLIAHALLAPLLALLRPLLAALLTAIGAGRASPGAVRTGAG